MDKRILGAVVVIAIAYAFIVMPTSSRSRTPILRVSITAASNKIFYTDVVFNNTITVRSMVDTGASTVSIMCDRVVNYLALPLGRAYVVRTANGRKIAHEVTIPSVRIGTIELRNVAGSISKQVDDDCMVLVGNTFLDRLQSVTLNGDRMHLVGKMPALR